MNLERLEQIRKDKGIPVTELANKLNINRSTQYRWINGEMKPSFDKVIELCKILSIDISEIVNQKQKREEKTSLFYE